MSGIYIKGVGMPTSCIACLLNYGEKRPEYGLTIYCPYSDGVISWRDKAFDNGRLASCGIVPVPPHGDLIDRDKLEKDIDNYIGGEESRSRFHHWVQVQSVVVPGDKGEET